MFSVLLYSEILCGHVGTGDSAGLMKCRQGEERRGRGRLRVRVMGECFKWRWVRGGEGKFRYTGW